MTRHHPGSRFRSTFVRVDGVRVVWRCERCGREYVQDYSRGPVPRRIGASGVALLARYWQGAGAKAFPGGCAKCERAEAARPGRPAAP